MSRIFCAVLMGLLGLSGCVKVDYENAPVGQFSGSLFVMWLDDGNGSGDGRFVFVPNPNNPLKFIRARTGTVQVIQPQMMYTDGGSIPRVAQAFKGFNPWGYAPAYMVHDWIFVAAQCNTDGDANAAELEFKDVKFPESAQIMAEAIRTLIVSGQVSKNDIAPQVISWAVGGPISRELWIKEGGCRIPRVSEDDRKAAESGIPGSGISLAGDIRTFADGKTAPLVPGKLVDVIVF